MKTKFIYSVFIIVFTLLSFEVLLRVFKRGLTWSEKVGKEYVSGYNQTNPTWFFSRKPNAEFDVDQGEFKFRYNTNHLGIRERDTFYTDSGAVKIMCLGDSYTEGFGAPYSSSYPVLLQNRLNAGGLHTQVYNAGVASSDPFYYYMLFRNKLQQAQPQFVFASFNSSDFTDFIFRGGMERFKPDGTVRGKPAPWYEPYYAKSFLCRFIVNVVFRKTDQNLFVTKNEYRNTYCPQMINEATQIFDSLNQMSKRNGFEFVVVIQPTALELTSKTDRCAFIKKAFSDLEYSLQMRQIKVINMWQPLQHQITQQNIHTYAYEQDGHFTPAGYRLFATTLLTAINKKYPDYWNVKNK